MKRSTMSTQAQSISSAYLARGTIGNVVMPGAPIVHFALVVTPADHKVSGRVVITQATGNGDYSGQVEGAIHATGLGAVTQVVSLTGMIYGDGTMPIELSFEANLAINHDWTGQGGFSYGSVHVDQVPVEKLAQ